jgi:pyridinium-3,5-bisthiocarboxylic acid mononucleotide nickel chelatase
MTILRIEPYSGISGDMFLGALASLADNEELLVSLPERIGLPDVKISLLPAVKCGISCTAVNITIPAATASTKSRHLPDILSLIEKSEIGDNAKSLAARIFQILAEAEARVHNVDLNKIHFHEVGAVDSLLDIIGSAELIACLGVTKTFCQPICTGFGYVDTSHGKLPVPAPATELLLHDFPCYPGQTEAELCTPTGAAILKALNPGFSSPTLTTFKSAYGSGTKDFEHPNCLRLSLCRASTARPFSSAIAAEEISLIQTNLDDMPAEQLGSDFQNQLFSAGALDVFFTNLIMKKGRPGILLEVLCPSEAADNLSRVILEETYSLGVRIIPVQRYTLKRRHETVETEYGSIKLKCTTLPSGRIRKIPEYADCQAAAEKNSASLQEVYFAALAVGSSPVKS